MYKDVAELISGGEKADQKLAVLGDVRPQTVPKRALANGVDLHSPVGQKFLRAIWVANDSGDKSFESYKGYHVEKAEWRKKLAAQRYQHITEKKVSVESWKRLDFKKATYKKSATCSTSKVDGSRRPR